MDAPKHNEILLKVKEGWLYYSGALKIITTEVLEEVPAALAEVERLVKEYGWQAAGFLSYEAATAFDPALRSHAAPGFPYLWFGLYATHRPVDLPEPAHPKPSLTWKPGVDSVTYSAAVDRIRDYIGKGKTYQVNYTIRLQAEFPGDPWEFFLYLADTQNRYAAYVDTGRYIIASASPELFFELDGETITSRPMKGTVKRGRSNDEDLAQADWLRASEKNRSENVMIVDMVRNDLGRIARPGTVQVPELYAVERYPTLWQMTSTVRAQTDASLARIFSALFPCASITGAPKVSTMRIIHELESTPRRIYTGSIGYISPGRKACFNVAIRTALIDLHTRQAEYGTGGGIVWDSTGADEYAEALLKARLLSDPSPRFSLLETMLWTPSEGYFLRERHIARLLDSARYFDFPAVTAAIEAHLNRASASFDHPQRVRLLLDRTGRVELTASPLSHPARTVRARVAIGPMRSDDVFLFHKTTFRDSYERARGGFTDCDDILLYIQHGELTEFTIGNLVVELNGRLVTPPVECGLLAGTFRAELLATGQVSEQVLPLARLKEYKKIFRVNSLRKWENVIILQ